MIRIAGVAALLASTTPGPSAPPTPAVGPYVVDAEENMCLLTHRFGTGSDQLTIGFQPMFLQRTGEIIILRADHSTAQHVGKAKVVFGPHGRTFTADYFSLPVPKTTMRLFRLRIDAAAFTELKTTSELSITAPPLRAIVGIPGAAKALAALDNCQRDLLKSWGVDPANLTKDRAPHPHGNPASYFGYADYPSEAVHQGVYGRVVTVLQIDATGLVSACRVVASAGTALNDATCKVARKIKFDPAHDGAGAAIASIYVLPVRWTLPGAPGF